MEIVGLDMHTRESRLAITADDGTITDHRIADEPGAVHRRVGRTAARCRLVWRTQSGYNSQMRTASISAAKNNLSALLREVRAGASVTITDRGVPIARLTPPPATTGVPASAIELAQAGRLVLPTVKPDAEWLGDAPSAPRAARSAVDALLAERTTGR